MKVLLVATLLLFAGYGLLIANDWKHTADVGSQAANSVGVYAGVPEQEINRRLAQLDEREAVITERETAMAQAETRRAQETDDRTLLFISLTGNGRLGLILMNFYLDTQRRKSLT